MAIGIASWRGTRVSFSDGMCGSCAVRFRRQWNLPEKPRAVIAIPPMLRLVRLGATMAVATVLILAARPLDESRTPSTTTAPPETVFVPTPVDQEPRPAAPVPHVPRRVRAPRDPSPALALVSQPTTPVLSDADIATAPVIIAATTIAPEPVAEPPSASTETRRFRSRSTFASLPHAGLTQQTP